MTTEMIAPGRVSGSGLRPASPRYHSSSSASPQWRTSAYRAGPVRERPDKSVPSIALVALGYTMVYGIIELINFAHGDVFMVSVFVSMFVLTTSWA